jgi:membrane protease YdiL (CAAX protease family)
MNTITAHVRAHSLVAYFALAYAWSWSMVLLVPVSLAFALAALLGPALAAIAVTALTEGRAGTGALLRRAIQWRVGAQWYLVAVGLPVLVGLAVVAVNALLGGQMPQNAGGSLALTLVLAALVVGEEIGWRGYALPHLQERYNSLVASLILGVLWACWHLANATIPGLGHYVTAFPAFLLYVVAQTVLFTWIANHTRGSVLLAWVFHAAINVSGALLFIGDQPRQWWLGGLGFAAVAAAVVLITGPGLAHRRAAASTTQKERV